MSPWQNASDQSAHSFLPPKVDTSNCRWGWGLPGTNRPSEEATNSQHSRKGCFQLAHGASGDNSHWNLEGEFHQTHEDATVHAEPDKASREQNARKPGFEAPAALLQVSSPATFEKVNRSQVGAVVLLPAPDSFRGGVSAAQGNFQTEQSKRWFHLPSRQMPGQPP